MALELARRGRASAVVAVAPNGTATPLEQGYLVGLFLAKRVAARALLPLVGLPGGAALARTFFATERTPWRLPAAQVRRLLRSFARSPDFVRILAATAVDPALGMRQVRCPVLLVQGGLDLLAPGQPDRYLFLLPDARLRRLPRAGHAVVSDAPRETARLILDFLADVEAR